MISALRRLDRCEELSLVGNELSDLSMVLLPQCRVLHVTDNRFAGFKVRGKIVFGVWLTVLFPFFSEPAGLPAAGAVVHER